MSAEAHPDTVHFPLPLPQLEIEDAVYDHAKDIAVDLLACTEILHTEQVPIHIISALTINPRVTSPHPGKWHTRAWHRSAGIYSYDHHIYLNVPNLIKMQTRHAEKPAKTQLHEIGHLIAHVRGEDSRPEHPTRSLALVLGGLAVGTLAPSATIAAESGKPFVAIAAGFAGLFITSSAEGAIITSLDKRGYTASGQNEAYANEFAARYLDSYPDLVTIQTA